MSLSAHTNRYCDYNDPVYITLAAATTIYTVSDKKQYYIWSTVQLLFTVMKLTCLLQYHSNIFWADMTFICISYLSHKTVGLELTFPFSCSVYLNCDNELVFE